MGEGGRSHWVPKQIISTSLILPGRKHRAGADQEPRFFFSIACYVDLGCVTGVLVTAYTGFCWGVWP